MQSVRWQTAPEWSFKGMLLWLLPAPPADQLPALPKFNRGRGPQLTFLRIEGVGDRYVLRLWQSDYFVGDDNRVQGVPLWFGMVTRERIMRPLSLVTTTRTDKDWITPQTVLSRDLVAASVPARVVREASRVVLQIVEN